MHVMRLSSSISVFLPISTDVRSLIARQQSEYA